MVYAVEADLNLDAQRLIELTDNASAPGVKDSTLLAALEAEAEALINGVLGGKFPTPFSPVPTLIKYITAWVWCYRLYRHREVMNVPQSVMDDYKRAMEWLELIAIGDMQIGGLPPASGPQPDVSTNSQRGFGGSPADSGMTVDPSGWNP